MKVFPLSRPGDAPFDWWSIVHFSSGLALGLVIGPWWLAIALLVGYEVFEAGLRRIKRHGEGLFAHESWKNIGVDIVVGTLGWIITAIILPLPDSWHWV